jgi:hypothetical protein
MTPISSIDPHRHAPSPIVTHRHPSSSIVIHRLYHRHRSSPSSSSTMTVALATQRHLLLPRYHRHPPSSRIPCRPLTARKAKLETIENAEARRRWEAAWRQARDEAAEARRVERRERRSQQECQSIRSFRLVSHARTHPSFLISFYSTQGSARCAASRRNGLRTRRRSSGWRRR